MEPSAVYRRFLLLSILVLLSSTSLKSQDPTGNLEGRVLDQQGQPLASANVIVRSPSLQGVRGTTTSPSGLFRFLGLPPGVYTVDVSLLSFRTVALRSVRIRLGMTTTLGDVALEEQSLVLGDVVVSGERPIIDPSSPNIGATLITEEFRSLPLQRDFLSIPTLLPQANASPFGEGTNFSGATGMENRYLIDGSEVTEPVMGFRGLGLPYNFIKDIEIRTGGYSAEFRSSLGGIVNATTYSGGNEFTGQAFSFYTGNGLSANANAPAESRTTRGSSSYDIGLGVGGPIVRDKLWFYAAYNPSFFRQEVLLPGLWYTTESQTTHAFVGKLTWKATDNTTLTGSIAGDPTTKQSPSFSPLTTARQVLNEDAVLQELKSGTVDASFSGVATLSDALLLEGSISHVRWIDSAQPLRESAKSEVQFVDVENSILGGGIGAYWNPRISQTTVGAKATLILAQHTIKGGIEYREKRLDDGLYINQLQRFSDSSFVEFDVTSDGSTRNRIPSAFLQDTWQVLPSVTVNAGLRWDGQFIVASDGHVHQKILGQFQPRVGFVALLGEPGTERVYGSAGRFYEELGLNFVGFYSDRNIQRWIIFNHDPRIDPTGGEAGWSVSSIPAEIPGLKGQFTDEYVLGYERRISSEFKAGIRGIYRRLGQAVEDVFVESLQEYRSGNPGEGVMTSAPRPRREYTALVATFERPVGDGYSFMLSYVLSRTTGNYPGLFYADLEQVNPNVAWVFDVAESYPNSTGLLPNDVTHILKLSGSYELPSGFSAGAFFLLQSGTPLSEFGGTTWGPGPISFLVPRGTAGRTPMLWDLNLRFSYNLAEITGTSWRSRLILDILHVASQRKPTAFNQTHYFGKDSDGNQTDPNPFYMTPTHYQQPMSVRLGLEFNF